MHIEHLVLAALRDAPDTETWSTAVQTAISAVTEDNAAMAVLGVGADHQQFRALFSTRTAELERRWVAPLDASDADVQRREQELEEARTAQRQQQAQSWRRTSRSTSGTSQRPVDGAGRESRGHRPRVPPARRSRVAIRFPS